jgi:hypothetical protein
MNQPSGIGIEGAFLHIADITNQRICVAEPTARTATALSLRRPGPFEGPENPFDPPISPC